MFHSVGRIMRWAGAYRKRMVLGFVCSFFATWCTAGPVVLAAWALGQLIVDAWGEESLSPHLPWLCLGGIVVLILLRFFFTYWKNRLQESIGTERAAEQRMELGNVLKRVSLGYFAKNDLPACRVGGADRCAGVRLCPAGDRPPERPHCPGEPPGSGGAVRGGH